PATVPAPAAAGWRGCWGEARPTPGGWPTAALRIRLRPRRACATRTKPSSPTTPSDRGPPPPVAGAPFPYVRTQNPCHCGLISHGPSPEPTLSLGSDDPPASPRRGRMGLDAIPEVPTW